MDYDFFDKCIIAILEDRFYAEENIIGEDLSDTPGVKVIFDGYGENDDGEPNENMQSYAIFIHKNAGDDPDFEFPEHESAWRMIIHRPREEVCVYAWYDVENDNWDIIPKDDFHADFPEDQFMEVLRKIYDSNFASLDEEE